MLVIKDLDILITLVYQDNLVQYNHTLLYDCSRLFPEFYYRTIGEQTYDGVVKEKEMAQQQYTQAVSRGQSTGLVR